MLFPFLVSLVGLFFLLANAIRFCVTCKNRDVLYRIITAYLVLLFCVELLCHIIGFLYPNSNFFLSHYYFNFQFIALNLFFYKSFSNKVLKQIMVIVFVSVLLFLGYQYYDRPSLYWEFNLIEVAITSIPLLFYAFYFIVSNLKTDKHNYFYFCNGLIIYVTSSAGIFLSGNSDSIILTEPFVVDFWFFNSLFYILYQFLIYKEWRALNFRRKTKRKFQ
ncbi:hypothetical protein D3C87_852360 [compost metagenome]